MGMFDSFYFEKGVLPDNKVSPDHEFQTKSLDCSLDKYTVYPDKTVIKRTLEGDPLFDPLNFVANIYSYEWLYENEDDILNRVYLGSKYQEYAIIVKDNKLVHAEKICEEGY